MPLWQGKDNLRNCASHLSFIVINDETFSLKCFGLIAFGLKTVVGLAQLVYVMTVVTFPLGINSLAAS